MQIQIHLLWTSSQHALLVSLKFIKILFRAEILVMMQANLWYIKQQLHSQMGIWSLFNAAFKKLFRHHVWEIENINMYLYGFFNAEIILMHLFQV